MSLIVGIRFHGGGKTYHFDASPCPNVQDGDYVVVETSRGRQLGQVVTFLGADQSGNDRNWKPILRIATPRDLVLRQVWEEKEAEALDMCRELVSRYGLQEVKFVSAEYSLEGENLTFLYCYEGKGEPNLGKLFSSLTEEFSEVSIDLRRVGPRDAAKIIGGLGVCGKEVRCCTGFMTEFTPISIRLAKEQGVSLAPSEITGMCGRLRCCLMHEHDLYKQAKKDLPKRGKKVNTPRGEGKVIRLNPLMKKVFVDLGQAGIVEFDHQEVEQTHQ